MNNLNVLITAQIGAGKTQMMHHLARESTRVVVLDREAEYILDDAFTTLHFRQAISFLLENRDKPFRLIFRGERDIEFQKFLEFVKEMQLQRRDPETGFVDIPLAVILDEAKYYGETKNEFWPIVDSFYRLGRRWRVNLVAAVQADVDVATTLRRNSHVVVAMRQHELSQTFRRKFRKRESDLATLETLIPGKVPEHGVHYLIHPPEFPLWETWRKMTVIPNQ